MTISTRRLLFPLGASGSPVGRRPTPHHRSRACIEEFILSIAMPIKATIKAALNWQPQMPGYLVLEAAQSPV
jgi:hypothetical protein